jgi:hypothetical protein
LFRGEVCVLEDVHAVRAGRFAALFARARSESVALFADLYGEHIARLWYLAAAPLALQRPERVDVQFDPTVGQLSTSPGFDPMDHPELAPQHAPRVAEAAARVLNAAGAGDAIPLKSGARLARLRPFVLRAFSDGETAAVLLQVIALRNDGRPGLVQFPMAAYLHSNLAAEATLVVDEAECDAELGRDWRPVL